MLNMKIKQNPGSPNKEYNAVFKYIHQDVRAYPRSKKKRSALINDWENVIAYWKESKQIEELANKLGLFQI